LGSIAKTTSGKIQRHLLEESYVDGEFDAELKELGALRAAERGGGAEAGSLNEIEDKLKTICDTALEGKRVGLNDNLFEIGASSLKLIEIHERIDLLEEERIPLIETFLLSLQALAESILGRKLEGAKVEVSARPAHGDLYRRYFSGAVGFGCEVSALVVPESWLDHPSPFADPALHRVSVVKLEALAERLKGKRYTAALVEELMASGGQGGRPLEDVARRLSVSKRTLIRRLGEAGTTYRELRDAHRRKLAVAFLSDTSLTAAEIAYRLGYEDASNFGRACHRWFGRSPGALRKRLRRPARTVTNRRRQSSRTRRRRPTGAPRT